MKPRNIRKKILELKEQGLSYNKIISILKCSKGTVSYHLGIGQKLKSYNRQKQRKDNNPLIRKIENFSLIQSDPKSSKLKSVTQLQRLRTKYWGFHNMRTKTSKYATPNFTLQELEEKLGDNPTCYLTGDSIDLSKGRTYNLDHIIPVSRGGSNDLDNLGLATKQANMSKTDMTHDEYIEHCKKVLLHHGYNITKSA